MAVECVPHPGILFLQKSSVILREVWKWEFRGSCSIKMIAEVSSFVGRRKLQFSLFGEFPGQTRKLWFFVWKPMQGSQGKKFVFPFLSTSKLKITKYDFFPSPSVITSFFLPAVLTHLGCQKLATNYFSIRSPSPKKTLLSAPPPHLRFPAPKCELCPLLVRRHHRENSAQLPKTEVPELEQQGGRGQRDRELTDSLSRALWIKQRAT